MASAAFAPVVRYVHRIAAVRASHLTDSDLLNRFTDRHDEEAFAMLVHRHGRLVLGVCQRIVRDWHAAEDCFQAVFLVLATKAESLRPTESLGPWLHSVAYRVASKSRSQALTRRRHEQNAVTQEARHSVDELIWRDLRPMLDDAVALLHDKYRIPFILCYLQGRTVSDIARELGQPKGTVAAWLARAREQLRKRLVRRGITLSGAALALALSEGTTSAAVSPALAFTTIKSAGLVAAGRAAVAASVSSQTAALMEGAIRSMMLTKLRTAAVALVIAAGTAYFGYYATAAEKQQKAPAPPSNEAHPPRRQDPVVTQHKLELEIFEIDEKGAENLVSHPTILTLDRQTGTIAIGPSNAGANWQSAPLFQCSVDANARPDGKIQLSLLMERFQVVEGTDNDTRVTQGASLRIQKVYVPGAKIEFEMDGASKKSPRMRVRIATSEVELFSEPLAEVEKRIIQSMLSAPQRHYSVFEDKRPD